MKSQVQTPSSGQLKSTLFTLLKLGVAIAIVVWLVQREFLDFRVLVRLAQWQYLPILLGLPLMNLLTNHYRWLLLLRAQGLEVTYFSTLPLTFIGYFFNFAVPGGVGGDVVKAYYLMRDLPGRKLDATVTILLDRIMGVYAMLLLAGGAVLINPTKVLANPEMRALASMILICLMGSTLFCVFVFSNLFDRFGFSLNNLPPLRWLEPIKRLHGTVQSFRRENFLLAKCVLVSWISHLAGIAFIGWVVAVTGADSLPWSAYFFVVPLGFIAMALPIAPAGIGIGQAAFYFLFKLYIGKENQFGPNAITAWQAAQFTLGLVGAWFFLQRRRAPAPSSAVAAAKTLAENA